LEAKTGASQGQIKSAVLSLKLAHFEYLKERLGRIPIVLLDEIYSDLDSNRLNFITAQFSKLGQIFVTTSKLSEIRDLGVFNSKFEVESGVAAVMK
jgi:DNA replication and repair protein RecF